jgi:hypothetical protein
LSIFGRIFQQIRLQQRSRRSIPDSVYGRRAARDAVHERGVETAR